ncbi:IS66 family insertion sequence element accessory protein TnpB [Salmonella enterica]|nr:IS66 family insertion sequence element accessory protein TnpB [Salmonella enterica]EAX9220851.1 IS66 family insertion sequence element accessory protein TnpB [Salmonella enterica]EBD1361684.1 IS66 family insertion sequence element accessory protein TnpB [Salmonella enterica]EBG6424105.1 IS66 family insertion sequence element accessory protein TnpB [Salmonella enterica]ECI9419142.1 IS66 family insertion sequence element accessory protein TnpB [Salmonella enterica]
MISISASSCIWLVADITNMRNGFNGLASKAQSVLKDDPFSGHLFIFRWPRGDTIKVLWADSDGKVHLTPAQLSILLEG